MADIELVIKIPEEDYTRILSGDIVCYLDNAVRNGTPLPKGHGRIGDLDALEKKYQKVAEEAKKAAQAGYEYTQKEKDMAADEARNDANIT